MDDNMPKPALEELLANWEGNYKKGLLTFWLLLILHGREAYAFEMSGLIAEFSQNTITADEKSIYRALNRFEKLGIVVSSWQDSEIGPRRRYYRLTATGSELLRQFIRRNILLFQTEDVSNFIHEVLIETDLAPEGGARV
jgi:DNA-binding PadR family transcriptional regulator